MVTNAQRIEKLQAQLAKVKKQRDGYKARLDKHIEKQRKHRETLTKRKRTEDRDAKLAERRKGMKVWNSIKKYWTTNIPGDDARDPIEDFHDNAKKLIDTLEEADYDDLAEDIACTIALYDPENCDMSDDWAFYDDIRKKLELAHYQGMFN